MNRIIRRALTSAALVVGIVFGPLAMATVFTPAVSWACDWGQVWDPGINACAPAPPPPPIGAVGPVTWCIGAPIPFVPMSWCVPVGPT